MCEVLNDPHILRWHACTLSNYGFKHHRPTKCVWKRFMNSIMICRNHRCRSHRVGACYAARRASVHPEGGGVRGRRNSQAANETAPDLTRRSEASPAP